jgi:SAM-dependent methyltransferase
VTTKAPRAKRSPSYVNASRVHLSRAVRRFAKGTKKGMLVLDAGAGTSPYRKFFKHARYEAADFAELGTKYAPLDYVCDITDIPVEDARFDRILCNQVLEHLPEPGRAMDELHRVLKPGGRVFLSVPLFYEEHQKPYDFYRYTQFSLRRLFEEHGFVVVRIDWLEGYLGTVSHQFHQMYRWLPGDLRTIRAMGVGWRILYVAPMILLTKAIAGRLRAPFARADIAWKYTETGMPKNYVVVARKPAAA